MSFLTVVIQRAALVIAFSSAAQAQLKSNCKVEIGDPAPGTHVGGDSLVNGRAVVPAGNYLWLFAHKKGLGVWWPQGGAPANPEEGKWSLLVTWGTDRDAGATFEVTARVVDAGANAKIKEWFRRTEQTGTYPGMPLPAFIPACPAPPVVSVIRD